MSTPNTTPPSVTSTPSQDAIKQAKVDIESIILTIDRLTEKFEKIESVQEGLVFQEEIFLVRKILERCNTEEENLRNFKESMQTTLKQMRTQLGTWKKTISSPIPSNLENTLRGVTRILTTPSALIFGEEASLTHSEKPTHRKRSPSIGNAANFNTARTQSLTRGANKTESVVLPTKETTSWTVVTSGIKKPNFPRFLARGLTSASKALRTSEEDMLQQKSETQTDIAEEETPDSDAVAHSTKAAKLLGESPTALHETTYRYTANKKKEENLKKKILKKDALKKAHNGKFTEDEVEILLKWAEDSGNLEMQTQCCCILAGIAYPTETVKWTRQKILSSGLLELFLNLAAEGILTVHLEIEPEEVKKLERIAEGVSGIVYKAMWKDKLEVAMKEFKHESISFDEKEFRRELALLCLLENDNLVPCFGACTQVNNGKVFIICELMEKGSLNGLLKDFIQFMDLNKLLRLARDIARGMEFLHSLQIIHRDLKSSNLLINSDITCKLIDFGTSSFLGKIGLEGATGTPQWMAPEVLKNGQYSLAADVYSFAIVMWELMTAQEPYENFQVFKIADFVMQGGRPPVPTDNFVSKEYVDMMSRCWDPEPIKRPTFFGN